MAGTYKSDALVEELRDYEMTPAETREQRISLIMGLRATKSTLTREKVDEILTKDEGSVAVRTLA